MERTVFLSLLVNAELLSVHTISRSSAQGMQMLEKYICQETVILYNKGSFTRDAIQYSPRKQDTVRKRPRIYYKN